MSLYYSFVHEFDLSDEPALQEIAMAWISGLDGQAYEPLGWFPTERTENGYLHSGATKLPRDLRTAWKAIQLGCQLLSQLRQAQGGSDWSVTADDHDCRWIAQEQRFDPN